jgi:DNA-binding transcriptional MerR regulator
MYTPMQVSEMLKIPPSTLRRYSSVFAAYLSPQLKSKKRSYTDGDIVTLQRIKELARKLPLDQVGPLLTVVEEQPAPESSLSLIPTINRELQRLDTGQAGIVREIEELRAAFAADHSRLIDLEKYLALPWWVRLFRRPPG